MTRIFWIKSAEIVNSKSRILLLVCVGVLISCNKLLLKTKSQNSSETGMLEERVSQSMSGRLKSPTITVVLCG